jgi:hypothetical protein
VAGFLDESGLPRVRLTSSEEQPLGGLPAASLGLFAKTRNLGADGNVMME